MLLAYEPQRSLKSGLIESSVRLALEPLWSLIIPPERIVTSNPRVVSAYLKSWSRLLVVDSEVYVNAWCPATDEIGAAPNCRTSQYGKFICEQNRHVQYYTRLTSHSFADQQQLRMRPKELKQLVFK
jgi:hypothetical protein